MGVRTGAQQGLLCPGACRLQERKQHLTVLRDSQRGFNQNIHGFQLSSSRLMVFLQLPALLWTRSHIQTLEVMYVRSEFQFWVQWKSWNQHTVWILHYYCEAHLLFSFSCTITLPCLVPLVGLHLFFATCRRLPLRHLLWVNWELPWRYVGYRISWTIFSDAMPNETVWCTT